MKPAQSTKHAGQFALRSALATYPVTTLVLTASCSRSGGCAGNLDQVQVRMRRRRLHDFGGRRCATSMTGFACSACSRLKAPMPLATTRSATSKTRVGRHVDLGGGAKMLPPMKERPLLPRCPFHSRHGSPGFFHLCVVAHADRHDRLRIRPWRIFPVHGNPYRAKLDRHAKSQLQFVVDVVACALRTTPSTGSIHALCHRSAISHGAPTPLPSRIRVQCRHYQHVFADRQAQATPAAPKPELPGLRPTILTPVIVQIGSLSFTK